MCGSLPFQRVVWGAAWVQGHKKRRDIDSSFLVAPPRLEREFRLGNLVFIYSTSLYSANCELSRKIFDNNLTTFAKMRGRRSNTRTTHDAVKRHRCKGTNYFRPTKRSTKKHPMMTVAQIAMMPSQRRFFGVESSLISSVPVSSCLFVVVCSLAASRNCSSTI